MKASQQAPESEVLSRRPGLEKTLMVVEDNEDSRLILKALLRESFRLIECASGIQALKALQSHKPDLIIMDISLPEMDGVETLAKIRSDPSLSDIPVIALTAHAMAGDRAWHLEAGFNDYISKPVVDERVLLSAIERQLNGGAPGRPGRES